MSFFHSNRMAWYGHAATAAALALGALVFLGSLYFEAQRVFLYLHHGLAFRDAGCSTAYCDYTMFWLAGDLLRHGQAAVLYDHARYTTAAAHILPIKDGYLPFVYPPTVLAPWAPLSLLPLVPGFYLYSVCVLCISALLLRRAGIPRWCIALGLASPAAMWDLYIGQLGLLCGSLLVYGLSRLPAAPKRMGLLLSLLCIKPQYALLVPVVVLARRRWAAVLTGSAGLALMLAVSWVWAGPDVWRAYLSSGRAGMRALLELPFQYGYQYYGSSVFWMLRSLRFDLGFSYAGQALSSVLAVAAVWRVWRRPDMPMMRRLTMTVMLIPFASPYGFTDDLSVWSVMLGTLARKDTPWRNAALAWLWVAPAYTPRLVATFGFLPTPLLLVTALAIATVWQNKHYPAEKIPAPTPQAETPPQYPATAPKQA